jgi:hypothetical protein
VATIFVKKSEAREPHGFQRKDQPQDLPQGPDYSGIGCE